MEKGVNTSHHSVIDITKQESQMYDFEIKSVDAPFV